MVYMLDYSKLKIKDNICLKQLEKFGFRSDIHIGCYYFVGRDKFSSYSIRVFEDRILEIFISFNDDSSVSFYGLPSLLFDIIKADFVEKVV